MTEAVIQVEDLWKEYTVGAAQQPPGTFYDVLSSAIKAPLRRLAGQTIAAPASNQFWALRELDFDINRGEVFGIVGRNGAGKSTLLKIFSRITAPTRGRVTVRGRIASLLEVGTGFHPELSGRENIYLNATILGMSTREIDRKLDAIVAFSEVESFLDTPVKRYSSGMYVRLAFAVAAHVEADVLLIDEVLAVGDAEFQKRCMGTMGDIARGGRTVIFVSHNLAALRNLCTSGLLLAHGRVEAQGSMQDVLGRYQASAGTGSNSAVLALSHPPDAPAALTGIAVQGDDPANEGRFSVGSPISFKIGVDIRQAGLDIGVFVTCCDSTGVRVFTAASFFEPLLDDSSVVVGQHEYVCRLPADLLNAGDYSLDVVLLRNRTEIVQSEPAVASFRVDDVPSGIAGWNWPILGVTRPKLAWSRTQVRQTPSP